MGKHLPSNSRAGKTFSLFSASLRAGSAGISADIRQRVRLSWRALRYLGVLCGEARNPQRDAEKTHKGSRENQSEILDPSIRNLQSEI